MKSEHNFRAPFIIGFDGTAVDSELKEHLKTINPVGVILFKRNITSIRQVSSLVADLKELLGPIIVAVDHEGGVVSRFSEDCPVPPSPSALRYANSEELTVEACRIQSELLDYLGFNLNFVPVSDLAVDPENEAIGTRSYSADPDEVARYGEICFLEHQNRNIATTAKHFPGHGRTGLDSHYTNGCVRHDTEKEFQIDIEPFKRLIQCGIPAVMAAHLTYPIVDKGAPASLSPVVLNRILRDQLKFTGVTISDCVEMAGLSDGLGPEEIVKRGLDAGMDLFISSFSLKKSKTFQRQMRQAYVNYRLEYSEKLVPVLERIETFRDQYVARNRCANRKPSHNKTIALHRRTLEKVRCSPLSPDARRMMLVDLTNYECRGINADLGWNRVSRIVDEACSLIEKRVINFQCDLDEFQPLVDFCNANKITCVLLTANGYTNAQYDDFMRLFSTIHSSVHIALLDIRDLKNHAGNEWATRGFNTYTGKMLAEELLLLARQ